MLVPDATVAETPVCVVGRICHQLLLSFDVCTYPPHACEPRSRRCFEFLCGFRKREGDEVRVLFFS